jgi:predicted P-loop ATPase
MRSKLVVENAELTIFNKADSNEVKAFLSRQVDRDRLPYDRLPRDLPRQCIIFATTNKDRFLQDETGNRRMWPIQVNKLIDTVEVRKNLDLLYAEAIFKYKNKEELCLRGEAATIAEELQNERYNQDDWQDHIKKFLNEKDKTTILKIWEECFMKDTTQLGYREQARIGKILRRLGWVRKTVVIDGEATSGFAKKY